MRPEVIAVLVDKGISLSAAAIALLYGYRVIGKRPGESVDFDKWHAKFGRPLRICGWVMIACFAPLLVADLARVVAP